MGLALLLATARPAAAQAQEAPVRPELHGFLLVEAASKLQREPMFLDERLRLDLAAATGPAEVQVRGDLFHDAAARRIDVDLREAFVHHRAGPFDLRAGRFINTWGVGDLVFINDLFPKDWDAFFSGRSIEYLKLGLDAVELGVSQAGYGADLVVTPVFTPDRLPGPRFALPVPFGDIPTRIDLTPAPSRRHLQYAARAYAQLGRFDVALYGSLGYARTPSSRPSSAVPPLQVSDFYPRLATAGASLQGSLAGGTLSAEAGYHLALDDRAGSDPFIPNSQTRALLGYQRPLLGDLSAGMQIYLENISDHAAYLATLPHDVTAQRQQRWVVTARLEQQLRYQTIRASAFAALSPSDHDWFVQSQLDVRVLDELSLAAGALLFGGDPETTFFGRLGQEDSAFVRVRFDF